ncbi:MAG: nitrilase-related carbon-nitrogen hydrolase [Armatimonadota bacterium]
MKNRSWLHIPVALVLAGGSGWVLARAFAPLGWGLLVVPGLWLLLLGARLVRPPVALLLGAVCAVVAGRLLAGDGNTPRQMGNLVAASAGLAVILCLTAMLASFGAKRLRPGLWVFFVASVGVAAELLTTGIFPANIALPLYRHPGALAVASYTGIWGVSFLVWLIPAALLFRRSHRVAVAAALLLGIMSILPRPSGPRTLRVAAVQARTEEAAVRTHLPEGTEVAVWAEHLMEAGDLTPNLSARRNGVYLAASFVEPRSGGRCNTACLISPSGRRVGSSDKQHRFGREKLIYSRGSEPRPVRAEGFTVGMPVCFDTMFTDTVRRLAEDGAEVALVPVCDPRTATGVLNHLHRAATCFRAAENGIPIVWADANGRSSVISAHGEILAEAPPGARGCASGTVALRRGRTLFNRIGDRFAWLCAAFAVILFAAASVRKPLVLSPLDGGEKDGGGEADSAVE